MQILVKTSMTKPPLDCSECTREQCLARATGGKSGCPLVIIDPLPWAIAFDLMLEYIPDKKKCRKAMEILGYYITTKEDMLYYKESKK